jgi:small nuclear ribonucleoprotein (snRNP)-like protein
MGAAALIPFVPNVVDNRPVVNLGNIIKREIPTDRKALTNYIDSTIILNTSDNPLNYRTVVHAYDMTLETVMDEYTPYDNGGLEYGWEQFEADGDLSGFDAYRRTMTLSNLPDNYDKYELSVWKHDLVRTFRTPRKVFSRTYDFGFPPEVWINLHIGS